MQDIIRLRAKAKSLEPLIRIGKNGLTEGMIKEIRLMLSKKRMIKIKLLKAFIAGKDKKQLAEEIAENTDSILVEQIGNIITLNKK